MYKFLDLLESEYKEDVTSIKDQLKTKYEKTHAILKEAFSGEYTSKECALEKVQKDFLNEKIAPKSIDAAWLKTNMDYVVSTLENLSEGDIKIIINNGDSGKSASIGYELEGKKRPGRPAASSVVAPVTAVAPTTIPATDKTTQEPLVENPPKCQCNCQKTEAAEMLPECKVGDMITVNDKEYVVDGMEGDTVYVSDEDGKEYDFNTSDIERVTECKECAMKTEDGAADKSDEIFAHFKSLYDGARKDNLAKEVAYQSAFTAAVSLYKIKDTELQAIIKSNEFKFEGWAGAIANAEIARRQRTLGHEAGESDDEEERDDDEDESDYRKRFGKQWSKTSQEESMEEANTEKRPLKWSDIEASMSKRESVEETVTEDSIPMSEMLIQKRPITWNDIERSIFKKNTPKVKNDAEEEVIKVANGLTSEPEGQKAYSADKKVKPMAKVATLAPKGEPSANALTTKTGVKVSNPKDKQIKTQGEPTKQANLSGKKDVGSKAYTSKPGVKVSNPTDKQIKPIKK